jgi:uroporphyrin-3 C-methyltransferase
VKDTLAEIDRLAAAPLAPAMPELGTALHELRNLRATRALAQPRSAHPAADGAGT